MPAAMVKKLAKEANVPVKEAEKKWHEAKSVVDKQYPDIETDSDRYYALVSSITKNMLGLKDKQPSTESDESAIWNKW